MSATTPQPASSEVQTYITTAEQRAWDIPEAGSHVMRRPIHRVGIIGAGTMGSGIAMNFLSAGIPVTMIETQQAALDRGLVNMRRNYETSARKGKLTLAEVDTRLALLHQSLDMTKLGNCELIIEAVFEDMDLKKRIFVQLDAVAPPGTILATNTSGLDVNDIAQATRRPSDVIGLHFFSPANVMRLLEVVRGDLTADDVIATSMDIARRIGKTAVLVGVCPGFVGNRMLHQRHLQADQLVLEGAMPWDVDRVLRDFGFPMGPYQMADLAGLDIGWKRETSRGSTLREILCEADRRGQKTGGGFYDYDEQRRPTPSPLAEQAALTISKLRGVTRRSIDDAEILERCLMPLINEGAKILEQGKARCASDIDVVWLYGYGWPKFRGGPMYYAESIGVKSVLESLKRHAPQLGAQSIPAQLLATLAERNEGLLDLVPPRLRA
ncbi:MAG: 3-hydroxyacyl-CoA dehydrogenase NAD-binding domain-containing protein [Steroidobacteraceae bacterium]